jgi:8-oxo-dGTP diphosphatase
VSRQIDCFSAAKDDVDEKKNEGKIMTTTIRTLNSRDNYKYVMTFARHGGKWLFSRHKERDTWETQGGHVEAGETPLEAAKRELYEESGATFFDITPICDCHVSDERGGDFGQVFYAEVHVLGAMPPEFEMAEVRAFDTLPDALTYPEITPVLWHELQAWMNRQNMSNELWDVYNADRKLTGRTHRRGDTIPDGDFHLVVHVLVKNRNGQYLITKRAPNKGFPNLWENTGGSAVVGDDSLTAALREAKEETGLTLNPENGIMLFTDSRGDNFADNWLFFHDFTLDDVILQPGETVDARIVTAKEIRALERNGEFIPFSVNRFDELLALAEEISTETEFSHI